MDEIQNPPLTNREKARQPKSDKSFWCYMCDGALYNEGGKCKRCGARHSSKMAKRKDSRLYE